MTRKGYQAEYEAKQKLIKEFGFHNVFKNAISNQGSDYMVFAKGRLVKCVEVKECHQKKYYCTPEERSQFVRIKAFCDEHNIKCELWIKYVGIKGRKVCWSTEYIDDYVEKTLKVVNNI